MPIRFVLFFMLVFLPLIGCTSLHKRAEQLLDKQSFSEAIDVYEDILRANSNNKKAKTGLRNAKLGWINKKLIEVRLLRQANNNFNSAELLLDVFKKENTWKLFPTGAANFTQGEEATFSRQTARNLISKALINKQPLQSQFYIDKYKSLFQPKKQQTLLTQLQNKTSLLGQKQCHLLSSKITRSQLYYGNFIKNLCAVWNSRQPNLKKQIKHLRGELFHASLSKINMKGIPATFAKILQGELNSALKDTPWYHPDGNRYLKTTISGHYKYNFKKENRSLVHSYDVSIPYQEQHTENIKSKEQNNSSPDWLSAIGLILDVASSLAEPTANTTRTNNGNGTVTITQTKYRLEPKELSYSAIVHREDFDLVMFMSSSTQQLPMKVVHNSVDKNTSIEHHNNNPEIGLNSRKANIVGKTAWLDKNISAFVDKYKTELIDRWDQIYCNTHETSEKSRSDQIEAMFRCMKVREDTDIPNYIGKWFKHNMGVPLEDVYRIVGDFY